MSEVLKSEEENGRPVNVAMDCLCGKELGESLPYMAEGGYWIIISTLAGTETNVKLRPILTKGLHIVGSMLRNVHLRKITLVKGVDRKALAKA